MGVGVEDEEKEQEEGEEEVAEEEAAAEEEEEEEEDGFGFEVGLPLVGIEGEMSGGVDGGAEGVGVGVGGGGRREVRKLIVCVKGVLSEHFRGRFHVDVGAASEFMSKVFTLFFL
jgi:hypothetical protein